MIWTLEKIQTPSCSSFLKLAVTVCLLVSAGCYRGVPAVDGDAVPVRPMYRVPIEPDLGRRPDDDGLAMRPEPRPTPLLPEAGHGVAPFAVVVPYLDEADGPPDSLRRQLAVAMQLGARFILLPPGVNPSAAVAGVAPLVRWKDIFEQGETHRVIAQSELSLVLATALPPSSGQPQVDEQLRDLRTLLHTNSGGATIVVLDAPNWGDDPGLWQRLSDLAAPDARVLFVAFTEKKTFYWSETQGASLLHTPLTISPGSSFGGVLWIAPEISGAKVSIINTAMISDVRSYSRAALQERDELQNSLKLSPACGRPITTTVSCRNPTSVPLSFRAQWSSAQGELSVAPEILGFSLQPGEEYKQEFRLMGKSLPVKFMQPELILQTELSRAGQPASIIELRNKPWCCISERVTAVAGVPVIDGDPLEWAGDGIVLGHETQVLRGLDGWGGPGDLSAHVFVGRDTQNLYLGSQIYDDAAADPASGSPLCFEFLLDLRSAETRARLGDAFTDDTQRLRIRMFSDGAIEVSGKAPLDAKMIIGEGRVSGEIRVPFALWENEKPDGAVKMDAFLYNGRDFDDATQLLILSGNESGLSTSRLYGTFVIEEPGL